LQDPDSSNNNQVIAAINSSGQRLCFCRQCVLERCQNSVAVYEKVSILILPKFLRNILNFMWCMIIGLVIWSVLQGVWYMTVGHFTVHMETARKPVYGNFKTFPFNLMYFW